MIFVSYFIRLYVEYSDDDVYLQLFGFLRYYFKLEFMFFIKVRRIDDLL